MSGFSNMEQDNMWGKDDTFYMDEGDLAYHQEQLKFQQFDQSNQYPPNAGGSIYPSIANISQNPLLDPSTMQYASEDMYGSSISALGRPPMPTNFTPQVDEDDVEPPLMDELGIDPDRILEKTLAVLNPFRRRGPTDDVNFLLSDADLAGPLVFCLALGACLLFGGKVHFGYVYGLAMICCLMMYCLLSLMTTSPATITLVSVASVLGYSILPVVALSALGIFLSLRNGLGLALALFAVSWCSLSASRLFVTMLCESGQRPLVAYPCALLYGVFAIVAVF